MEAISSSTNEINQLTKEERQVYDAELADLMKNHSLIDHYAPINANCPVEPLSEGPAELLESYSNEQACRFVAFVAATKDRKKSLKLNESATLVPLPTTDSVGGHYGLYRIRGTRKDLRVTFAEACHKNIHNGRIQDSHLEGVQLDKDSQLIGFNGSPRTSLFNGDIIAVKEVYMENGVYKVAKFHLLARSIEPKIYFKALRPERNGFLERGCVLGQGLVAEVFGKCVTIEGEVSQGELFVPHLWTSKYCREDSAYKLPAECKGSKDIPLLPVIFNDKNSVELTAILKNPDFNKQHDVEAITVINDSVFQCEEKGRYDGFAEKGECTVETSEKAKIIITKKGTRARFWRDQNVVIGELKGVVEKSTECNQQIISLTVRATDGQFKKSGDVTVRQEYQNVRYCLEFGYLSGLDDQSNGKRIILDIFKKDDIPFQDDLSSKLNTLPELPIPPNKRQAYYIHNVLSGAAITAGSFPIQSGKLLTVAQSAYGACVAGGGRHIIIVNDERSTKILSSYFGSFPSCAWDGVDSESFVNNCMVLNDEMEHSEIKKTLSTRNPHIIIGTMSTLKVISESFENIRTVQFTNAEMFEVSDLVMACSSFPTASFGVMGDDVERPVDKHHGFRNLMDAVSSKFRVFKSNLVYTYSPKYVEFFGKLFNQNLISMTSATTDEKFPIHIITTPYPYSNGEVVPKLVKNLGKEQDEISIIGFFADQKRNIMDNGIHCEVESEVKRHLKPIVIISAGKFKTGDAMEKVIKMKMHRMLRIGTERVYLVGTISEMIKIDFLKKFINIVNENKQI